MCACRHEGATVNTTLPTTNTVGKRALNIFPMTCDATSALTLDIAFVCLAFQKLLARNPDRTAIFNPFVPYLWGKKGSFSLLECTQLL